MIENNLKKNKSGYFIFPMFGYHLTNNSPLNYYLINTYISKDYKFYIAFDNSDNDALAMIIYQLQQYPEYKDCWFDDDNKEVVLEFDINDRYKWDFDMFIKGQYSKFSESFKKELVKFYGNKSTRKQRGQNGKPKTEIFDIIYPTKEKIEDIADYYEVDKSCVEECGEIIDPPNLDKESFKKVIELYGIEQ